MILVEVVRAFDPSVSVLAPGLPARLHVLPGWDLPPAALSGTIPSRRRSTWP
ncbi:MAG: hypothetical protein HYY06_18405 [Deltaproteobacteria bacterium]|nr:hypothetical protein [Deltaproteobacteria bacterium]